MRGKGVFALSRTAECWKDVFSVPWLGALAGGVFVCRENGLAQETGSKEFRRSVEPGGTERARRLASAQRGIKPGVEYFYGGYLVDDGAEVFCLFPGGVQFFLRNDGGEAFIHEDQGKSGEG